MAAETSLKNGTSITVLANALQMQSQQAAQLLQTLPTPPQAEGKGSVVDVHA